MIMKIDTNSWLYKKCFGEPIKVYPRLTPSGDMNLVIKNNGRPQKFKVQCEIVGLRNSPNPYWKGYAGELKWVGSIYGRFLIYGGASAQVKVANTLVSHGGKLGQINILSLREGKTESVGWAAWGMEPDESLPEYDLVIKVFAPNMVKPCCFKYTVRPKTFHGPLEMFEIPYSPRP